jgi:hypothetical protein
MSLQRRVADARGREFIEDYQYDAQIQKAIVVLMEKLGRDVASVPELAFIPPLVADREKTAESETAAAAWEEEYE